MRTSESGALVLRKSYDRKRAQRPPQPPGVKPPPKGHRWPSSMEEAAERQRTREVPLGSTEWPVPAAPGSIKSRLSLFYRNQTCDRPWQVPCWLASLLLHLLAVVVLGSLTVPVSRNRTIVSLLFTFGEITAPVEDSPVEFATAALEPTPEPTQQADDGEGLFSFDAAPPVETGISTDLPLPRDRAATPEEQPTKAAGELPGEAPPGQAEAQGGAEPTRVVEASPAAHDDVVDRFIQFDIGKLQGEEGTRARDEFQRLGTDALPSLVRGLNRSASIHASCPVMVITSKIESLLRENPDPELLKYAIDHIGRGVPSSAPHYRRLRTLLAQLRQTPRGQRGRNVFLVEAQLQSNDRQRVLNAVQRVVDNYSTYTELEKRDLAWSLIRLLHHRYPNVRAAAQKALVALAGGEDFGPKNDRLAADRFAAAGEWSRHFDAERYEESAAAALMNGEHLEEAGKLDAARRQFQKVAHEYPGTTAADDAVRRLEAPKSFVLK